MQTVKSNFTSGEYRINNEKSTTNAVKIVTLKQLTSAALAFSNNEKD
jgi:hypothetical protein